MVCLLAMGSLFFFPVFVFDRTAGDDDWLSLSRPSWTRERKPRQLLISRTNMTDYAKWDKMAKMLDDDGDEEVLCPRFGLHWESTCATTIGRCS